MDHIPSGEDKISKTARVALNVLRENLDSSKQYSFLDIGCGDGRDIAFLSSNFENLTFRGIDISSKAIEKAIKLTPDKEKVTFKCMDWKELDDRQHDIIYISGVYHFFNLAERKSLHLKLKRILKPQGFFFLTTLSANDTQYYGKGMPVENDPNSFQGEYFIHFSSEKELREDFKFLKILDLFEYFHKNYAKDTVYHTMWSLIGENGKSF